MSDVMTRLLAMSMVVPASIVSSACAYALGPRALIEGRGYRTENLEQLSERMSQTQVRSLIGEPFESYSSGETITWRYHAVYQQRACEVSLLGIPVRHRPKETLDATLVFGANGLEAAHSLEQLPERTTSFEIVARSRR